MLNENTSRIGNRTVTGGGQHAGGFGMYFYTYAPVYWKSATINSGGTGSTEFSIYYNITNGTNLGNVDDTKTLTFTSTGEQDVDLGWYFPSGYHAFVRDTSFNMYRSTSIDGAYNPTTEVNFIGGTSGSASNTYYYYLYDIDYVKSGSIGKNGIVHSPSFNEVGPISGLINYWPMNGHLKDYGEKNNDGTASGATIDYTAPRDKMCYDFTNSTADKIDLIDVISCSGGEEWSWSFWGYKTSFGNDGWAGHQDYLNSGRISFNSTTQSTVYTSTPANQAIATSAFPINEWFNCIVTHSTGNIYTIYLNGSQVGQSTALAGDISVNRIGDNPGNSSWTSFDGLMFDFRIYNKVLSTNEINILSNMFDTDGSTVTNMSLANESWYVFGELKEQL